MYAVVHHRCGGFIISHKAAAEWASRITGKTYTERQSWSIETAIRPKARAFNADFQIFNPTECEMAYIVITQTEKLVGYKMGNPIPPFSEGEREAMAKPMLEAEGVTDYVFGTIRSTTRKYFESTVVHSRCGGFVISRKAAAEWASRITGKTYTERQLLSIEAAIRPKTRAFNAGFQLIDVSEHEMAFMVITRSERLRDYKMGNPIPPFPEGEREAMAKPLLEAEGVTDYVFQTLRSSIRVA